MFALPWDLESVSIVFGISWQVYSGNTVFIKLHKLGSYMELVRKSMCFLTVDRKAFSFSLVFTLLDYFWKYLTSAVTFDRLHASLLLPV